MPEFCNVCSAHFSPVPHFHTHGNIWAAKCSYVLKLVPPNVFAKEMEKVYNSAPADLAPIIQTWGANQEHLMGRGRFANEHWVHSHPSVQPCDLYDAQTPAWGFNYKVFLV